MGSIGERIRPLREALELGRNDFAIRIGVTKDTLRDIEVGRRRPNEELLEGIGKSFPQFSYWLLTGKTDEANEHISPDIERIRRDSKKGKEATG
ncbi:MAG: helix-turn-helix domain-containing protein [Magnetococcales bacterium]|nr:helix-turn-helix domain-containing protein [Magnetococcales bacterium]